jgi:hypothetical protein
MSSEVAHPMSDSRATEAIIALRYWARATNYEPTSDERAALVRCEEHARNLWRVGVLVGGGTGIGMAAAVRVPMVQRLAVGAAFASAGGFYSQYKSNLPCLQALLELERQEPGQELGQEATEASPLAARARQILRDGGPATIRNIQRADAAKRAPTLPADLAKSAAPAVSAVAAAVASSAPPAEGADTSEPPPAAHISEERGTPSGDSWEAVRQRYQARAAGDDPAAAGAVREAWRATAPPTSGLSEGGGRPKRVVRNAYGDEVVVE